MATTIQLLRSDIEQQRPSPGVLANGTPMVNLFEGEPGLFFAARDGSLFKIGPASVGNFAPNSSPQGHQGNCKGELWIDTSGANPNLKFFDGSDFVSAGQGTVTSVDLALPAEFSVSGGPITAAGTLTATYANQNANLIFAGPGSGSPSAPAFRSLVAGDIPGTLGAHTFTGTISMEGDVVLGSDSADTVSFNGLIDTDVIPTGTVNLGGPADRWDNVYTNDLHLSNEGHTNDVDGTWGSYTIQEGEEDLFLINRRTGKRYKFLLQEV